LKLKKETITGIVFGYALKSLELNPILKGKCPEQYLKLATIITEVVLKEKARW